MDYLEQLGSESAAVSLPAHHVCHQAHWLLNVALDRLDGCAGQPALCAPPTPTPPLSFTREEFPLNHIAPFCTPRPGVQR